MENGKRKRAQRSGRAMSVFGASALVTTGLFAIMQGLVANDGELNLDESERPSYRVNFQGEMKPQEPRKVKIVKPPKIIEIPPLDVDCFEPPATGNGGPHIGITGPKPAPKGPAQALDFGLSDGDMIPFFNVVPDYPRCASERGLEGYAIVSMTVEADGTPSDIEVLESEPGSCFDKPSMKAASRFRFKPRVVNNVAERVENVTYRFSYKMDSDSD